MPRRSRAKSESGLFTCQIDFAKKNAARRTQGPPASGAPTGVRVLAEFRDMAADHPDFVDYQTFVFQGLLPCFSSYLSFFWDGDVAKELPVQVTTITTAQGGAQGEWAGVGGVGWGFHTLFWTQMAPQRLVPGESSPLSRRPCNG